MTFLRPPQYFYDRFHPMQEDAWLAYKAGLDLVLPWGRRSGKSDLCIEILIEDIEEYCHDCLYVAKTQKQARKIVWKKLKRRLRGNPDWKFKEASLECEHTPSGANICLYGADIVPDNMTGSGYRIIVCDEYALWKKPEIVQTVLSPMLGDYNGQIIFVSTKRGKNHFYALHQRALKDPSKYFVSEGTIFDNSFITPEGRAKVLSEYDGGEKNPLYMQEILNQYMVFEGQVVAIAEETYTERRWDPGKLDHCIHWRGVDLGFSPDPTACVWVAYDRHEKRFQMYSEYEEQALLVKEHAEVITAHEPYEYLDSISDNDPQVLAEFEDVGLSLTPAGKANKRARLLRLVNALRTGKLKISRNCLRIIAALQSYTWEMFEAGDDPHLVDALRYVFTNLVVPEEDGGSEEDPFPRNHKRNSDNNQSFGDPN